MSAGGSRILGGGNTAEPSQELVHHRVSELRKLTHMRLSLKSE
jgi:hypothetical protein